MARGNVLALKYYQVGGGVGGGQIRRTRTTNQVYMLPIVWILLALKSGSVMTQQTESL